MAGWIRFSRGRLLYRGRITRAPFAAWSRTPQGEAVVAAVAQRIRFALFGKERAAEGRLWRQLSNAARDPAVVATIQSEADAYLARLSRLAYCDGLPREGVNLHRLVVVPRVMLNDAAYRSLSASFRLQPALTGIEADEPLREFFVLRLLRELHLAIVGQRPSPRQPLQAGKWWLDVGVNTAFVWRVPFNAPKWAGHHYLFELTRDPITRAVRKEVAARIQRLEASLPSLAVSERNDILRRAADVA